MSGESHGEEESERWSSEGTGGDAEWNRWGEKDKARSWPRWFLQQEEILCTFSGSADTGVIFSPDQTRYVNSQSGQGKRKDSRLYLWQQDPEPVWWPGTQFGRTGCYSIETINDCPLYSPTAICSEEAGSVCTDPWEREQERLGFVTPPPLQTRCVNVGCMETTSSNLVKNFLRDCFTSLNNIFSCIPVF